MPPRNYKKVEESGAVLVTNWRPAVSFSLREIYDPPVLLFAHGRLELVESIMLGVIGTPRPTG
jgi:DNA processing protein